MIESFVNLTYRGLSLGKGLKLTQVRPSSGYVELATPMPVGTHVAIAAEEGVTFDATVSWVNEQVAGAERTPGMVVVPAIAADPALAWWKARIALPDEDPPASRSPRNGSVTVRPRSHTEPGPPPDEAITEEIPTNIADLQARVAAARRERPTPASDDPGDRRTTAMSPREPESLGQATQRSDGEPALETGEHTAIIDDDHTSKVVAPDPSMQDPSMQDLSMQDLSVQGVDPGASAGAGADSDLGANGDPEAGGALASGEAGGGEAGGAGEGGAPRDSGGSRKRRKRR